MLHRIHHTREQPTFRAHYLASLIHQHFEMVPFDDQKVGKHDCVMLGIPYKTTIESIPASTFDRCRVIIIDNLQENFYQDLEALRPWHEKVLILTAGQHTKPHEFATINVPEWFWYFESLWYRSRDYHLYQPSGRDKTKTFFMPMRRKKPGRHMMFERMAPYLDQSIWSYVDLGHRLPGIPEEHVEDQRWFNPDWYDQTFFTIVNEDSDDSQPVCWSEKTCKPLAFFHPFILVAQQGLLKLVRSHGFETFPEVFDESYDDLPDLRSRVEAVVRQVIDFDSDRCLSAATQDKVRYNQQRFFNQDLVHDGIKRRVIEPVLRFIESA